MQALPRAEVPDEPHLREALPAPAADRYNGVPLGMEAFIPLNSIKGTDL